MSKTLPAHRMPLWYRSASHLCRNGALSGAIPASLAAASRDLTSNSDEAGAIHADLSGAPPDSPCGRFCEYAISVRAASAAAESPRSGAVKTNPLWPSGSGNEKCTQSRHSSGGSQNSRFSLLFLSGQEDAFCRLRLTWSLRRRAQRRPTAP
jgi:hypothetical protein